jgi:excisionase family DNA binding protein
MNDLLTTRQVQEILKVDRITVYRMLQDGRLKGVKIGQQWRFSHKEVERMLGAAQPGLQAAAQNADPTFPTHCVQTIQDLYANISQISAMVIDMQGNLLTEVSRPTRFCQTILSASTGRDAFTNCYRSFAAESAPINGAKGKTFFTCVSGLSYTGAPIHENGRQVGLFLTGQFYWQKPDPREEAERIRRIAAFHNLSESDLLSAAAEIPVIEPALHARVESWSQSAARAVESILHERTSFIERLKQIADLTQIS